MFNQFIQFKKLVLNESHSHQLNDLVQIKKKNL